MKKVQFSFCLLAIFLFSCIYVANSFQIKHGKIYDDQWREVYFHGMNIAVKVPPYVPKTDAYDEKMSFVKEDVDKLKQNGFNAIRLGIMWPGVQPKQGQFNETYLQEIAKIVKTAGDSGIYTILEFHQKVLSESFCGIGLPPWLIQKDDRYRTFPFPIERQKYPLNENMTPDKTHCKRHCTSKYFYSYDCAQGFDDLYQIDSLLNKKFTKFWRKLADCFKGCDYLIAYDLINEPWVGNQIRNPALLIPGVAQKLKLQKFYDRLSEGIRSVDDKTPICFQPTIVDKYVGTGYYHAPGGQHFKDKSILCYSYGKQNQKSIGLKVLNAYRLKVPSLISQMYGKDKCFQGAENYYQSWFYWYYKDFGIDRSVHEQQALKNEDKVEIFNSESDLCKSGDICKSLIRTYLPRVAGQLSYSHFCNQTSRFVAAYTACPDGQTILYMNKDVSYGNKYSIEASPKDRVQIIESQDEASKNYVTLKFTGKQKEEVVLNVIKQ